MKRRFVIINLDTLQRMKPLEAVIYSLVQAYTKRGIDYMATYSSLSKVCGVTVEQVRYAMNSLMKRGELRVTRRQYNMLLSVNQSDSGIIPPSETVKIPHSKIESVEYSHSEIESGNIPQSESVQNGKLTVSDCENFPLSHYLKNIKNNREYIIPPSETVEISHSESETEQGAAPSAEERRAEIIVTEICRQYKQNGSVYVPNWSTQTMTVASLSRKLSVLMKEAGMEESDESFAAAWRQFLKLGFKLGDQFNREHWTLDYIDKQFMTIYNIIKNHEKHTVNNVAAKGQRRISNDVLTKHMQRAAGIVQSSTTGEDVQGS